jgi:hypothetical protein
MHIFCIVLYPKGWAREYLQTRILRNKGLSLIVFWSYYGFLELLCLHFMLLAIQKWLWLLCLHFMLLAIQKWLCKSLGFNLQNHLSSPTTDNTYWVVPPCQALCVDHLLSPHKNYLKKLLFLPTTFYHRGNWGTGMERDPPKCWDTPQRPECWRLSSSLWC